MQYSFAYYLDFVNWLGGFELKFCKNGTFLVEFSLREASFGLLASRVLNCVKAVCAHLEIFVGITKLVSVCFWSSRLLPVQFF